jgi:hypothetical protein
VADELGRVQLDVVVNTQLLNQQLEDIRTDIANIKDAEIDIKLKDNAALRKLQQGVKLNVNDSQVQAAILRLDTLAKKVGTLSSLPKAQFGVEITGAATDEINNWRAAANKLNTSLEKLKKTGSGGSAKAGVLLKGTPEEVTAWAEAAEKLQAALSGLTSKEVTVGVTATGITETTKAIDAALGGLQSGGTAVIQADIRDALGDIDLLEAALAQLRRQAAIPIQTDIRDALLDTELLDAAFAQLREQAAIPLTTDIRDALADIKTVEASIKGLRGLAAVQVDVDADTADAIGRVESLQQRLAELIGANPYTVRINVEQSGVDPFDIIDQIEAASAKAQAEFRQAATQGSTAPAFRGDTPDIIGPVQQEFIDQAVQHAERPSVASEINRRTGLKRTDSDYLNNEALGRIATELGVPQPKKANRATLTGAISTAGNANPEAVQELRRIEALRDLQLQLQPGDAERLRDPQFANPRPLRDESSSGFQTAVDSLRSIITGDFGAVTLSEDRARQIIRDRGATFRGSNFLGDADWAEFQNQQIRGGGPVVDRLRSAYEEFYGLGGRGRPAADYLPTEAPPQAPPPPRPPAGGPPTPPPPPPSPPDPPDGPRDPTDEERRERERLIRERRALRRDALVGANQSLQDSRAEYAALRRNRRQINRQNAGPFESRDNLAGAGLREDFARQSTNFARTGSNEEQQAIQQFARATVAATNARRRQTEAITDATRLERQQQTPAQRTRQETFRRQDQQARRDRQQLTPLNALLGGLLPQEANAGRPGGGGPGRGFERFVGRRFAGRRLGVDDIDSAFSNALVGGAFPALFGQGLGASIGGAAGGGLGGLLGGQLGFGGSLLGTAVGGFFDELTATATEAGKALQDPTQNLEALAKAGIIASGSFQTLLESLNAAGRGAEATALLRQETAKESRPNSRLLGELSSFGQRQGERANGRLGELFAPVASALGLPGTGASIATNATLEGLDQLAGVFDPGTAKRRERDRQAAIQAQADQARYVQQAVNANAAQRQSIAFGERGLTGAARSAQFRFEEGNQILQLEDLQQQARSSPAAAQRVQARIEQTRNEIANQRVAYLEAAAARQRELVAGAVDLRGQERSQAAGFSPAGRRLFGQEYELAQASAAVSNRGDALDLARREQTRIKDTGGSPEDQAAATQAVSRAVLEYNAALRSQAESVRSAKIALEQAQTAAAQGIRNATQARDTTRATLGMVRPDQAGERFVLESQARVQQALNTREDAFTALQQARRNDASPAEIAQFEGQFTTAGLKLETTQLQEQDSILQQVQNTSTALKGLNKAFGDGATAIKQAATQAARQIADIKTGDAAARGGEGGVNKYLRRDNPALVENRQLAAELQLTAEAKEVAQQLGVGEIQFRGNRTERNAEMTEFIQAGRSESRAPEDIGRIQEDLLRQTENLASVTGELYNKNKELAGLLEGLNGSTKDLANKKWDVYVNVNSGSVGGSARAAQVAI